jgi:Putative MetA-pathway of phenol degradation
MSLRHLALAGAISVVCANGFAGSVVTDGQDKSRYNLLDPTPVNLLREFATDRPDKTETPTTVDAGHYQLEMDFATFTLDRANGVRTEVWNVAPLNLRIGLLNNVELSLVFDSYFHVNEEAGITSTMSGVGDFTTRVKINLWGNDGGQTAFALLPVIKFPTNTDGLGNNSVEGGVIFPFSVKLPWKIDMGMGTGIAFARNESGSSYHAEFLNSVTFGHEIIGKLSGYCEFFANVSTERDSDWIGTVDLGLTYALTENLQLDCGCNIGVTHAADDFNAFSGISIRF